MSKHDWFRNETWNDEISDAFFKKLQKSRSNFHKAQYLRIQAYYLEKKFPQAAMELLNLMVSKYTEDTQKAQAYVQFAKISLDEKNIIEAIKWLRMAIEQQRIFPNVRTQAHLIFGKLVVENNLREYFEEVKNYLNEIGNLTPFPVEFYESYGISACIAYEEGNKSTAHELALKALQYADKNDSGLRYHKSMGLVENRYSVFHNKIMNIVNENEG